MITVEHVRAAGGIVHSDGNIFFTNLEKLNAATHHLMECIEKLSARLTEALDDAEKANTALHEAATSLHTISCLAGFYYKTDAGETFMGSFPDVRSYARNRHKVARELINTYYLQPHVKAASEVLRAAAAG